MGRGSLSSAELLTLKHTLLVSFYSQLPRVGRVSLLLWQRMVLPRRGDGFFLGLDGCLEFLFGAGKTPPVLLPGLIAGAEGATRPFCLPGVL